jgi:hypothetical protein
MASRVLWAVDDGSIESVEVAGRAVVVARDVVRL